MATPRRSNGKRGTPSLRLMRSPKGTAPWSEADTTLISTAAVSILQTKRAPKANRNPVFLIEDNRLLRDGLTAMLSAQGLKVVATARSGGEALRQVMRLKPGLVLLDSAVGDREGLRLVQTLKTANPAIRIVVMHLKPANEDIVAFVRAGVSGFIMKDAGSAEFISTIRTVADGGSVLPPSMTRTLFSHVAGEAAPRKKRGMRPATRMTVREREVTALIAKGLSNKDIAAQLEIAAHTVKSHVRNILEKLSLRSRLEVAAYVHGNRMRGPAA